MYPTNSQKDSAPPTPPTMSVYTWWGLLNTETQTHYCYPPYVSLEFKGVANNTYQIKSLLQVPLEPPVYSCSPSSFPCPPPARSPQLECRFKTLGKVLG